jgi:hypothetical protein
LEIASESRAFLVELFTDLRRDLADRINAEEQEGTGAGRELGFFDALLTGLAQPGSFPDDAELRQYVAGLARATDEGNEYERVSLEHRALAELGDALAEKR